MYLLETKDLVKSYKKRRVVNGVSLNIQRGEIVGLLGPNGAGKTTSFYMIVGVIKPEEGHVLFRGEDVTNLPMYKRARAGIGYLSQEPSIFRKLTVEENIMAVLECLNISRQDRQKKLEHLLRELDIEFLRKNRAYTLSGGERRRLEVTRALATNPSLILLDEPFSGIDPIAVLEVQQILLKLKQQGLGIIITDHNVQETLAITDRAYIMYEGKVEIAGHSRELADDPRAKEIYLGKKFKLQT